MISIADNFKLDKAAFSFVRDRVASVPSEAGYYPAGYRFYCAADNYVYARTATGYSKEHNQILKDISSYTPILLIDTEHLADDSVTASKIYTEAVTSEKIAPYCLTQNNLGNIPISKFEGYIEPRIFAAKSILGVYLQTQITAQQIEDHSILYSNISTGGITTAKIADKTITTEKIKNQSLSSSQIGEISTQHIVDETLIVTNFEKDIRDFFNHELRNHTVQEVAKTNGAAELYVYDNIHDYTVDVTDATAVIINTQYVRDDINYRFDLYIIADGTHTVTFPNIFRWCAMSEFSEAGIYHIKLQVIKGNIYASVENHVTYNPIAMIINISNYEHTATAPADGISYKGEEFTITVNSDAILSFCGHCNIYISEEEEIKTYRVADYRTDKDFQIIIRNRGFRELTDFDKIAFGGNYHIGDDGTVSNVVSVTGGEVVMPDERTDGTEVVNNDAVIDTTEWIEDGTVDGTDPVMPPVIVIDAEKEDLEGR